MEESRLYRSRTDTIVAGVCGGIGNYLKVDPILFRILFVFGILIGGGGLIAYIVMWIIVPIENTITINTSQMETENTNNFKTEKKSNKNDGNLWGGIILITIGGLFLIDRFMPRINFGDLWPVILIAVGAILIAKNYQRPKDGE
jgi:phage shock protein PspC (stress-responsive transcriptional regulator)